MLDIGDGRHPGAAVTGCAFRRRHAPWCSVRRHVVVELCPLPDANTSPLWVRSLSTPRSDGSSSLRKRWNNSSRVTTLFSSRCRAQAGGWDAGRGTARPAIAGCRSQGDDVFNTVWEPPFGSISRWIVTSTGISSGISLPSASAPSLVRPFVESSFRTRKRSMPPTRPRPKSHGAVSLQTSGVPRRSKPGHRETAPAWGRLLGRPRSHSRNGDQEDPAGHRGLQRLVQRPRLAGRRDPRHEQRRVALSR